MHFTLYSYIFESFDDREKRKKKRKLVTTFDAAVMAQFTRYNNVPQLYQFCLYLS